LHHLTFVLYLSFEFYGTKHDPNGNGIPYYIFLISGVSGGEGSEDVAAPPKFQKILNYY
jgi:hypothetical protein